jgi:hypothetical protein
MAASHSTAATHFTAVQASMELTLRDMDIVLRDLDIVSRTSDIVGTLSTSQAILSMPATPIAGASSGRLLVRAGCGSAMTTTITTTMATDRYRTTGANALARV